MNSVKVSTPQQQEQEPELLRQIPLISTPRRILVVYITLLALAEIVTTYIDINVGLIIHGLVLAAVIILAGLTNDRPIHRLLTTLVIGPLIRILSLTMPLAGFPRTSWYLVVSIPIFVLSIALIRVLGYSPRKIGFNFNKPLIQLLVIGSGFIFGGMEYSILRPDPILLSTNPFDYIMPIIYLLIGTGLLEELVFRGILQQVAEETIGKWGALIYITGVFMVLHIGWKSAIDLVFVFVVGGTWGWTFLKTRSIVGITIAHSITNIMLFLILPSLFRSFNFADIFGTLHVDTWGNYTWIGVIYLYVCAITVLFLGTKIKRKGSKLSAQVPRLRRSAMPKKSETL